MGTGEEVYRLVREIGQVYRQFLREGGLKDEPLARMTYYTAIRREYVDKPVDNPEVQKEVLSHIDDWMAEIQNELDAVAPPTLSTRLHVVTDRQDVRHGPGRDGDLRGDRR